MITGIIAVLFLVVIGMVLGGAIAADRAVHGADKALKTTIDHQKTVGGTLTAQPFKSIDFTAGNPDIAAAKSALAAYGAQISGAQALVTADRARLRAAKQAVAGSVVTVPERATLDQRRHRVEAALTALDSAQRALDLYKKTADFLHPFFDAFAAVQAANRSIKANDIVGAASQLKAAQDGVNKALDLAKRPAIPQQFERLLTSVNFLLTDMQGLINAVQAHDITGVHDFLNRVDGALNGASEYDPKIVDDYVTQLYSPLRDAYRSNLRVAAGG
ncbi:MAG: hypothetical protein AUG48_03100 [Actinobacteria bacterium 13_1_20CM_3_68_9]|nr:MAG: hypothetical protein AUG48_03100 [Actinobacteria bacterium 13_1_20CM_3_68_9]